MEMSARELESTSKTQMGIIKLKIIMSKMTEHGSDEQQGAQGILTLRHMQEARKGTHVAEELPHMEVDTVWIEEGQGLLLASEPQTTVHTAPQTEQNKERANSNLGTED